jgi:hypothetical protein
MESIRDPLGTPTITESSKGKWTKDQTKIGWQQIFFGRIARSITNLPTIQPINRNGSTNTRQTTWPRKLLRTIWDTSLKLWRQRNEYVHGKTVQSQAEQQRKAILARVTACYQQMDIFSTMDRDRIFTKSQDNLMQENPNYLKAWLKLATQIIQPSKKENKHYTGQRIMMAQYFKWHPTEETRKRVRVYHPRGMKR